VKDVRHDAENNQRRDPECQGNADIAEDVSGSVPFGANHFEEGSVVGTDAEKDIARHQPFQHDCANVEEHAVRLRADAHACRQKVEERGGNEKKQEEANSVKRTGDGSAGFVG